MYYPEGIIQSSICEDTLSFSHKICTFYCMLIILKFKQEAWW